LKYDGGESVRPWDKLGSLEIVPARNDLGFREFIPARDKLGFDEFLPARDKLGFDEFLPARDKLGFKSYCQTTGATLDLSESKYKTPFSASFKRPFPFKDKEGRCPQLFQTIPIQIESRL